LKIVLGRFLEEYVKMVIILNGLKVKQNLLKNGFLYNLNQKWLSDFQSLVTPQYTFARSMKLGKFIV
jgi:hypothetical protein